MVTLGPASARIPPSRRLMRPRKCRITLAFLLIAVVACLCVGGLAAREAVALRRDLNAARAEIEAAAGTADPLLGDISSINETRASLAIADRHLNDAQRRLTSARSRLDRLRPLIAIGRQLPGWPAGLGTIEPMVATAQDVTATGRLLASGFERFAARLETPATPDEPMGARLATALTAGEPDFVVARTRLNAALARRASIDHASLRGPLAPADRALATFDQRSAALREGVNLLVALPPAARAVLGMDGARTYAILGQNSAELRPTGGFIGSLGLVTLERGAIVSEDYRGSYTFDNPARGFAPLPEPMARYLGGTGMALRDANWSPDFPTSARAVEDILARQQDIHVDGVIGFTTYAVGLLLETLGPVTVAGFDDPVTATSWYRLAQSAIYFQDDRRPASGYEQNKERVLEPVLRAVLERVQSTETEELPRVLRAMRQAVRERQILLSFHDRAPATLAWTYQADGRYGPPPGDVLGVIDANLSYSKVSPYIEQRIAYEVWFDAQGLATRARATVTYENHLTEAELRDPVNRIYGATWDPVQRLLVEQPGLFGTYTRLYVPAGSVLSDDGGSGGARTGAELGFTTLEQYLAVPYGARRQIAYEYALPGGVNRAGGYRLTVLKQPGTVGHALEIRLHLPPELAGRTAFNVPVAREDDAFVYRGRLQAPLNLSFVVNDQP